MPASIPSMAIRRLDTTLIGQDRPKSHVRAYCRECQGLLAVQFEKRGDRGAPGGSELPTFSLRGPRSLSAGAPLGKLGVHLERRTGDSGTQGANLTHQVSLAAVGNRWDSYLP